MCEIFISADPELYACRSRSIRLRGVATSLRLENLFWQVLDEIGKRDGLSVPQLLAKLFDELSDAVGSGSATNFTSFLRVSCGRYLQLQLAGRIPADTSVPIGSLDSRWVLAATPGNLSVSSDRREPSGQASQHPAGCEAHAGNLQRKDPRIWTTSAAGAAEQSQVRQAPGRPS